MVLNLQLGEKKKVDVNFEAGSDITSTQGVQRTRSSTAAEVEVPCNKDKHEKKMSSVDLRERSVN